MTWILPKQLHTLAFALDTAALISDSEEQSRIYAQSLFLRSKVSPARTWSAKWKRDSWTAHLSGRILKPSLGERFETEWTSSLAVTPANLLVPPGNASAQTIPATSGHSSQTEFGFFDLASASSKTSRDTSASDSERSLANWNQWVTRCRGEYSQRVKSAPLTNASGSLSWPTTRSVDWKGCGNAVPRKDGQHRLDTLEAVVIYGHLSQQSWPTPCAMEAEKAGFHAKGQMGQSLSAMANRGELQWLTPATVQIQRADMQKRIDYRASIGRKYVPGSLEEQMQTHGQAAPVNPNTDGSRLESWLTPRANEPTEDINFVTRNADRGEHCHSSLTTQAKAWETPTVSTGGHRQSDGSMTPKLDQQVKEQAWATPRSRDAGDWMMNQERLAAGKPEDTLTGQATQSNKSNGKLNPRWVETLMGLPVGWTMPSCASPVTIAPTNCDSSETELCQQPQP